MAASHAPVPKMISFFKDCCTFTSNNSKPSVLLAIRRILNCLTLTIVIYANFKEQSGCDSLHLTG